MAETYLFGPFLLKPQSRSLRKADVEVTLGSRAFDILVALVRCQGEVLTQRQLMAIAWPGLVVESSNVRVQIAGIRRALSSGMDGATFISSVAGRGYCFVAPVVRVTTNDEAPALPASTGVDRHRRSQPQIGEELRKLPPLRAGLVGRDGCIREVGRLVLDRRIVSIVGPGGAGKTTLAILVAQALAAFGDATIFVDLSVIEHEEQVAETFASALGYVSSGAPLFPGLLDSLATRRLLVVLDNCEHVISSVAALCVNIASATEHVHVLTTSREALRIKGEFVHLIRPLAFPVFNEPLTMEQALTWPSVRLFVELARESGWRVAANDKDAAAIACLCRRLDGNPHAIGLVASRAGACGIDGILNLLASQFALHWQGGREEVTRHQSIESMIAWSHDLLPDRDKQVLYRLAVFASGFPIDAALDIVPDRTLDAAQVADAIIDLVDRSLVTSTVEDGETQFRLLETTRAFAAERLCHVPIKEELERKHAFWYVQRARLYSKEHHASLSSIAAHLDNMRAAIEWAFAGDREHALAVELSVHVAELLLGFGQLRQCTRLCERALSAVSPQDQDQNAELRLLEMLAVTGYAGGDYDGRILDYIERALLISQRVGDHQTRFHLLAAKHLALTTQGRFGESLEALEEYQAAAALHGNLAEFVIGYWLGGSSHHYMGHQELAEQCLDEAWNLLGQHRLRNLRYFEAKHQDVARIGLARVALARGRPARALALARRAIVESRVHPDSFYQSASLCFSIFLYKNLCGEAEAILNELESISAEYNMAVRQPVIDHLRGRLLLHRGSFDSAIMLLQQALDALPASRISVVRNDALHALAEALIGAGRTTEASSVIEESIELAESSLGAFNLADMLCVRARILTESCPDQPVVVEEAYRSALARAQQQGHRAHQLRIALSFIEWLEKSDDDVRILLAQLCDEFESDADVQDLRDAKRILASA